MSKIKFEKECINRQTILFIMSRLENQEVFFCIFYDEKENMDKDYKKIFAGNFIMAQRIVEKLQVIGINAIVKDESKSALLAGFASAMQGDQEIYVNHDETEQALKVVASVLPQRA